MSEILVGDCRPTMATLDENSVDAIVTDPPYELGFMGKKWDTSGVALDPATWAAALRVAKPGAFLLAFGGTRTYHRLACAIEDAGWQIRDQIGWVYGSGFPKSHNGEWGGTALKPAWEPICVARKPLIGTVEQNLKAHGTGALNIDGCRVATDDKLGGGAEKAETVCDTNHEGWDRPWKHDDAAREAHAARVRSNVERAEALGRWPANLIHDGSDEVLAAFPQALGQRGDLKETGRPRPSSGRFGDMAAPRAHAARIEDNKSAARFFYCAKASKSERGEGNNHPTVKPIALMRYLCRLVTPAGGLVLDPFAGSGSTGVAALQEGFRFVGIDLEEGHAEIARRRMAAYA